MMALRVVSMNLATVDIFLAPILDNEPLTPIVLA